MPFQRMVRLPFWLPSGTVDEYLLLDPTKIGLLGGRLDLKEEYYTAMVRAALLEGDVWVVESAGQWVTVGLWFKWPNILFTT